MRPSLLFAALGGYIALSLQVSVVPPATIAASPELPEARYLLREVQRIAARGVLEDCRHLDPIPLYEHAPSARDWQNFCEAIYNANRHACDTMNAMIVPDLRAECTDHFSSHDSHGS